MKFHLILTACIVIPFIGFGANKLTGDSVKVVKHTEYQYDYSKGIPKKYLFSEKFISTDARLLEEIEYLMNGMKSKHKKYHYDKSGNLIEELFFDNRDSIYKTIKYDYRQGKKIRKTTYDKYKRETQRKEFETDTIDYVTD